jgi:hypothetical protein
LEEMMRNMGGFGGGGGMPGGFDMDDLGTVPDIFKITWLIYVPDFF